MRRLLVLALAAGSLSGIGYALTPAQASPICVGVTATVLNRTSTVGPTCPIPTPFATECNTLSGGVAPTATVSLYTCTPVLVAKSDTASA